MRVHGERNARGEIARWRIYRSLGISYNKLQVSDFLIIVYGVLTSYQYDHS